VTTGRLSPHYACSGTKNTRSQSVEGTTNDQIGAAYDYPDYYRL